LAGTVAVSETPRQFESFVSFLGLIVSKWFFFVKLGRSVTVFDVFDVFGVGLVSVALPGKIVTV
jgi:hypothetical protein